LKYYAIYDLQKTKKTVFVKYSGNDPENGTTKKNIEAPPPCSISFGFNCQLCIFKEESIL